MQTWRLADLHAYVDDCLEPRERLAFEDLMADDPSLARRATMWLAQNNSIRSAFDSEGTKAFPISLVRHQNETAAWGRRAGSLNAGHGREHPVRLASPNFDDASRTAAGIAAPVGPPAAPSRRFGLAALIVLALALWAPPAPVLPTKGLGEAGVAAFRAFVRQGTAPVEIATGDGAAAQQWLGVRLERPVLLPAVPASMSLVGARVAPYPGAPAAFLVYDTQGGRVGLLARPLDAPPTAAPELLAADGSAAAVWAARGQGFALVGDLEPQSLLAIARDLFDPPAESPQSAPERGS